jgi:hypothetical protein
MWSNVQPRRGDLMGLRLQAFWHRSHQKILTFKTWAASGRFGTRWLAGDPIFDLSDFAQARPLVGSAWGSERSCVRAPGTRRKKPEPRIPTWRASTSPNRPAACSIQAKSGSSEASPRPVTVKWRPQVFEFRSKTLELQNELSTTFGKSLVEEVRCPKGRKLPDFALWEAYLPYFLRFFDGTSAKSWVFMCPHLNWSRFSITLGHSEYSQKP